MMNLTRERQEILDLKNKMEAINNAPLTINRRKKYYILVDVETVGLGSQAICYDIAWSIVDKQGNVYRTKAYCVREIFTNTTKMMEAYYWCKYAKYLEMLDIGLYTIKYGKEIIEEMNKDMADFNVDIFTAYNSNFDRTALMNTIRDLKIEEGLNFPKTIECVWTQAVNSIMNKPSYRKFAKEHGMFTDSGKYWKSSAETCYRFMMNNPHFEEQHIGIFDVQIEQEILAYANTKHEKVDKTPCSPYPKMVVKQTEMPIFYGDNGKFKSKEEIKSLIEQMQQVVDTLA